MNPQSWSVASDDYLRCAEASTAYFAEKSVEFAHLESKTNIKILDVACGTGVVATAIVKTLSPTVSVLSTDYAPGMVDVVRSKVEKQGWKNVKAEVMDATDLSLPEASMDAVFCVFGVMLMPDGAKALSEFHRVLVPGGKAVYTTWASQELQPLVATAAAKTKNEEPKALPWVRSWADLEYCKEQLSAAGFKEVRGVVCSGDMITKADKLDEFIGTIARNPGIRTVLLKDMDTAQTEEFKKNLRAVIVEKYGERDEYNFKADTNIALGVK
jgi:ubiquinone/menaquinone biosynthesis C-methylase UbiE